MLKDARKFLIDSGASEVPIYLLATQGMRNLRQNDVRKAILTNAHLVMNEERRDEYYRSIFKLGDHPNTYPSGPGPDGSVRVITGELEGVLAWVAINHGFQKPNDPTIAIFEIGGASMQIAFDMKAPARDRVKVCLPSGNHYIHAAVQKKYGVDSMREKLFPGSDGQLHDCVRADDRIEVGGIKYKGTPNGNDGGTLKWTKYVFSYNFFD
jgi:hypothetical protein